MQGHGLELMRHRDGVVRLVANPARARFLIDFDDELEPILLGRPIAEGEHFRKLVCRVNVQQRKRDVSTECLLSQPDKHV